MIRNQQKETKFCFLPVLYIGLRRRLDFTNQNTDEKNKIQPCVVIKH